jgi:hypothetical protein
MPKSRGRKPKKRRFASPAERTILDDINNTPPMPSPPLLPSQVPPHQERPTSKIKQIAMTVWRWLRTAG